MSPISSAAASSSSSAGAGITGDSTATRWLQTIDGWRRGASSALTPFGAHFTSRTAGLMPGGVITSSDRRAGCTSSDRREPGAG
jgi:hypothetical protein